MIHHVTGHSHPWVAAFPDEVAMRGFLSLLADIATRLEMARSRVLRCSRRTTTCFSRPSTRTSVPACGTFTVATRSD